MFAFWKPSDKPVATLPKPDRTIKFKEFESDAKTIDPELKGYFAFYIKHKHDLIHVLELTSMLFRLWCGDRQPLVKGEIRKESREVLCDVTSPDEDIILPLDQRKIMKTGYSYIPHLHIPDRVAPTSKTIRPLAEEKTQAILTGKNAPGIATIEFIAAILGQTIIKKDQIGFDSERNHFVMWDFENAFNQYDKILKLASKSTAKPEPDPATVLNLADEKDAVMIELRKTENYLKERYAAAFRVFCTPLPQLHAIVYSAVKDDDIAAIIYNDIATAIKEAKFKYLLNPEFRNFAYKNWENLTKFIDQDLLHILDKSYDKAGFVNLNKFLRSYQEMEKHIINSDDFDDSQRKILIKNIRIGLFKEKTLVGEVYALADEVTTLDQFNPIRARAGILKVDLKGNHANGEAVSATYNDIMHAAKTCMLFNACKLYVESKGHNKDPLQSLDSDVRYKKFLTEQRHSFYSGLGPIFNVLGRRTSSEATVSELKTASVEKVTEKLKELEVERATLGMG